MNTEMYRPTESRETDLFGKNVVIVGASSGLGHALAQRLSSEGSTLYLLSRTIEDKACEFEATKVNCDISDSQSVATAFERLDEATNKIDILVNCAGVALNRELEMNTPVEISDTLRINLEGAIQTSFEAYKRMIPQKSGHIVNVSSTTGLVFRDNEAVYAASKWGLRGFTGSLRLEAKKHGIRVSGVYPGGMKSNFWKDEPNKNLSEYMEPKLIAGQVVNLLKSDKSISPAELVLERGIF